MRENVMSTMSVKEALAAVLQDMRAMSAEQLRAELLAHKNGEIATALREAECFLASCNSFSIYSQYPLHHIQALLHRDGTKSSVIASVERLLELLAVNDSQYALAA
jgi:hypothetical protein